MKHEGRNADIRSNILCLSVNNFVFSALLRLTKNINYKKNWGYFLCSRLSYNLISHVEIRVVR